jgi:hypothetical protein
MANPFRDLPTLDPPAKANGEWTTTEDWCTPAIDGVAVYIRAGMRTDGASIPRIAWRLVGHPFQIPLLGPALGHDALYAAELVSREEADRWFLEAMRRAGIGWAKRNAIWLAVRAGGGVSWRRHTARSVARARYFAALL